jgi:hypothetical protein
MKRRTCRKLDRITKLDLSAIEEKISDLARLAAELRQIGSCCNGDGLGRTAASSRLSLGNETFRSYWGAESRRPNSPRVPEPFDPWPDSGILASRVFVSRPIILLSFRTRENRETPRLEPEILDTGFKS